MKQRTCTLFLVLFLLFCIILKAEIEDTYTKILPVKFSGFIKHESFWDTRQVFGGAEDENLFFPEPVKLDQNCCDINSKGQFDMSDIATRILAEFNGSHIKNAKLDGIIDVDFVGRDDIVDIVRMRRAFLTLTWDNAVLLGGQTNMPFMMEECGVRTVSRNTGRPIECYAHYPQIQIDYNPSESCTLTAAAMSQLEYRSEGPIGPSTTYLRNAIIPMLQFRADGKVGEHVYGAGAGYKRIAPRIKTNTGEKAHEFLSSGECMVFAALNFESVSINNKIIFAQNASNLSLIGGYAVHSIDPTNDHRTYTNFNSFAWWMDTDITHFKNVIPGFFIGVIKNLGTTSSVLHDVIDDEGEITDARIYGLGTDISTVFRFSPRFKWNINKFSFQAEVEYTRAAYGTITDCGDIVDTCPVGNVRLMVALYYNF